MNNEYRATKEWPYQIAAGCVVYRNNDNKTEILLLFRKESDGKHYHLPKGTLNRSETLEQCAMRETIEESGATGTIRVYLGAVHSRFVHPRNNIKNDKITHYFSMELIDISYIHDQEHAGLGWFSVKEAIYELRQAEAVKNEYEIVERLADWQKIA